MRIVLPRVSQPPHSPFMFGDGVEVGGENLRQDEAHSQYASWKDVSRITGRSIPFVP